MPMEPRFAITRSGGRLAYRLAGDAGLPPVLLLHGLPASSSYFLNLMEALSDAAMVVAPDLPGFGLSDPLPEATFDAFTDVIEALLGHLGVGRRMIYLHDFGAPVGLNLAMREPGLVNVSPAGRQASPSRRR